METLAGEDNGFRTASVEIVEPRMSGCQLLARNAANPHSATSWSMLNTDLSAVTLITLGVGVAVFGLALTVAIVSLREDEPVAAGRLFVAALLVPLPYLIVGYLSIEAGNVGAGVLLILTAAFVLVLGIPSRRKPRVPDAIPKGRIDERDMMFSRADLIPGTARFAEYYDLRPENRGPDDQFRANPGLLCRGSSAYHPLLFSAANASFFTIEQLRPYVDGDAATERVLTDAGEMTEFVKRWGKKLGAVTVGVTRLEDYHLYSVVGRGPEWGRVVKLNHEYAIALTVEMDKRALDSAPLGPAVMESSQQYVAAGVIAVQLAQFCRSLGYPARAHIDANYRVVCPLVARDAGLGEIGRMGLLMTPDLGPRVRIAVVTTDLPLAPDRRDYDSTVIDFCARCKKCADVCPAGAISLENRKPIDGVLRWQIDSEACYTVWSQIGTDCARCVAVCPYSHPDNALHNLVRRGVRNSALFRRLAVTADDVLYGRKPAPSALPGWQDVDTSSDET